jgi:predicted secreted protein
MGAASRDILVSQGGTRLLGINSKSMAAAKEGIDITTDEDNGYRLFLPEAGTKTVDISFSGVVKDAVIKDQILAEQSQLYTDFELEWPPVGSQTVGATLTGNFYLNGYSENGGGSDGAIEFDGTLQSSGAWTHTAGS